MAALPFPILTITIISIINNFENIIPEFEGNTYFSENYLLTGYRPLRNAADIEKFIKNILNKYNDAGFPFCNIKPEFINRDSITKKLVLHISEGERVIIRDYVFKTDGKTESAPLRKIAHIRKDNYFSLRNINQLKKTLFKTKVFTGINEYIVKKDDNYFLILELKEKSSDYIMATGSFAESDNYLTASLSSMNIFGSLRQFQFRYESSISAENNKRLFQLSFTEPVILHPVSFHTALSMWTYDSTGLTQFDGTFIAPMNNNLSILISSGIEMTNYLTDTGSFNYTYSIIKAGLQSEYYTNHFANTNRIFFDYLFRENERTRINYDGTVVYTNLFVKPHFCSVITDNFEYFDYIRLGGANSLRGYMEDEFLARKTFWVNLEYKLLPIYPLIDIAWADNDYKYSYGIGIDARTNLTDATIIFAWPENGKWRDGKVHILLEKSL
ncbi:MAG: hypothetical protein ACUVQ4_08305 [bacterium]